MGRRIKPGGTSDRGYGREHQQLRAQLLPLAYYTPCPKPGCGQLMLPGQDLDLGHVIPIALGGKYGPRRIEHAHCNRREGQALGVARRRQHNSNRLKTSRRW